MPEKTQGPRVLWVFCNGDLHYPGNILETRLQRRGQWAAGALAPQRVPGAGVAGVRAQEI